MQDPGIILADYLRDNRVIPEKCDLNDILFLMTPAETKTKLDSLITKLVQFEHHIDNDSPMEMVLPTVYNRYRDRYEGYTIRRLCRELHDFYKEQKINVLQKKMFQKKKLQQRKWTSFRSHCKTWPRSLPLCHNYMLRTIHSMPSVSSLHKIRK